MYSLIKALRFYQWIKNSLVFLAPLAAHHLFNPQRLLPTVLVFLGFCLSASGAYLFNDLMDLEADQAHPRKRLRPFASGALPLRYGLVSPLLVLGGIAISFYVSIICGCIVLFYVVLSSAYSMYLKKRPLADVFCLAALYTTRVVAGGFASGDLVSVWLLNFTGFLFLALGFLKRCGEYLAGQEPQDESTRRRGYFSSDTGALMIMGIASSFISVLVLSLYVNSSAAHVIFKTPLLLWGAVPLILFWQCRMWLSTARGYMHDDPIVYAAQDWVSHLVLLGLAIIYLVSSFDLGIYNL